MHPTGSATRRLDKIVHYFDKFQVIQLLFLMTDWSIINSFGKDYYNPYSYFLIGYAILDSATRVIDKKQRANGFYCSLLHLSFLFPVVLGSAALYVYYFTAK